MVAASSAENNQNVRIIFARDRNIMRNLLNENVCERERCH